MKSLKYTITTLFFVVWFSITAQQAQQKIEMKLDSIGNAKLSISMTLTAQQWQTWNGTLGNNPAALKREIERSMPAYFLEDFKLEKDDMNRSFTLSLKALGVCKIDKRGKWSFETGQKNANVTELTDHKFMLVSSPPELGGAIQQTYIVEFPQEAGKVKVDKDSFGESIFQFEMNGPGSGFNLMRWSGIFLIAAGGAWFGKNRLKK